MFIILDNGVHISFHYILSPICFLFLPDLCFNVMLWNF